MIDREAARVHLAWLMWCYSEGYVTAEDREIIDNWLLDERENLHPEDVKEREGLLGMADEVLDELGIPK